MPGGCTTISIGGDEKASQTCSKMQKKKNEENDLPSRDSQYILVIMMWIEDPSAIRVRGQKKMRNRNDGCVPQVALRGSGKPRILTTWHLGKLLP